MTLGDGAFAEHQFREAILTVAAGGEDKLAAVKKQLAFAHGRAGHGMGVHLCTWAPKDRARLHRFIKASRRNTRRAPSPPSNWFAAASCRWIPAKSKATHELFALLNKLWRAPYGQLHRPRPVEASCFLTAASLSSHQQRRQDSLGEMNAPRSAITQSQFEEAPNS